MIAIRECIFRVFGAELRCYVLEDGQRVIHGDDVMRLFYAMAEADREYDAGDAVAFKHWIDGRDVERKA